MRKCAIALSLVAWLALRSRADGPQDNIADKVRSVPPPGIQLSAKDQAELSAGVEDLGRAIAALRVELKSRPALLDLVPDVEIYYNAVRYPLTYNEFFRANEIAVARKLLAEGRERCRLLREGQAPWITATGLVVRGYVSRIDRSVQPYGLVVPASYRPNSGIRHRLDIWFHGRGETLSELNFIADRERSPGLFTPRDAFVLHPYGRYCNANHFAGEVDTFEALDHIRRHYSIDEDRLVVRGFSMGGAACWHFAVHHAGFWTAAAPGAGFSETPDFLKVFQREKLTPAWYEKKLWHLYDCPDYAINLFQCPVVAYSGEKDSQKQAADVMARALANQGMSLMHIIGPGMGHAYHPQSRREIDRRIDAIAARGRNPMPARIRFATWTLRYNRMLWVVVDRLEQHWEQAGVEAEITGPASVNVATRNIAGLTLSMPAGHCSLDNTRRPSVVLDGQKLAGPPVMSDRSWDAHFRKEAGKWKVVASASDGTLAKKHGLQGPIDDAFMDRFLMVRPTGMPSHEKVGRWADREMKHSIDHWRRQFRGDAPIKNDVDVTAEDIADANLVLWGDPASNRLLARIADRLPVKWGRETLRCGTKEFASNHHVPVLIFPNPLNPQRYVVLNSGFTFREYDYLNNARQVPKLPDFAVLDVNVPPTSRTPGGIVTAGFFTERWELPH